MFLHGAVQLVMAHDLTLVYAGAARQHAQRRPASRHRCRLRPGRLPHPVAIGQHLPPPVPAKVPVQPPPTPTPPREPPSTADGRARTLALSTLYSSPPLDLPRHSAPRRGAGSPRRFPAAKVVQHGRGLACGGRRLDVLLLPRLFRVRGSQWCVQAWAGRLVTRSWVIELAGLVDTRQGGREARSDA